jgi:hypothetical protein
MSMSYQKGELIKPSREFYTLLEAFVFGEVIP